MAIYNVVNAISILRLYLIRYKQISLAYLYTRYGII